jgi:hypothetical protein
MRFVLGGFSSLDGAAGREGLAILEFLPVLGTSQIISITGIDGARPGGETPRAGELEKMA